MNDQGAWQGSHAWAEWTDPESGEVIELGGGIIVVTGEGAHDGLYAEGRAAWAGRMTPIMARCLAETRAGRWPR